MIKGYHLIQKFEKQNRNTIWKQLASIGKKAEIYSNSQVGIMPYLGGNTFYIYAVCHSLVVVCLDNCPPREELADEDPFNDGQPLYFTENSHRVSPVWQLSETIKLIKKQLEENHDYWSVLGVLLTESTIINADGMQDVWDNMKVKVIDQLKFDPSYNFQMNPSEDLTFGKTIMSIIKELNIPQTPTKTEDDAFFELVEKFCNENYSGNTKGESEEAEKDKEEDDKTDNSEEEKVEEEVNEVESLEEDFPNLFVPSSDVIEQNNNVSVKVKILPPIQNPRAELDKLVGCQDIKKRIDELLALTLYNKMVLKAFPHAKIHEVSLHSVFFGKPGTGKTTVCKIFGSLLREAGALSRGHVLVADRGTFLGTLWGDEERSVRQVVEKAQGGVLMIDEAYLLNGKHEKDPGKIVIPMLMELLADESQRDIAVVLCGYKEPLMHLLDTNPGLQSRFPNRFEFSDFTIDELMEITRRRIGEYQYHFTHQAWQKYKNVLTEAYQVRDSSSWGNARFVANQLERIFIQHAQRCVKENPSNEQRLLTLTPADITPIEVPRPKPRIGF